MLKVNASMLVMENDKYYYMRKPFTGIAIVVVNGVVQGLTEYKDASRIGAYINEYLPNDNILSVDSEYLDPENEEAYEPRLCYQEELFTGIAYDFEDNGVCTGESLYIKGCIESCVGYFKSGELQSVELGSNDFSETYEWYETGQIKNYEVFEREHFCIKFEFMDDGRLNILRLDGDYFERIVEISDKLHFKLFQDKDELVHIKCADRFFVNGTSVNDGIIDLLRLNGGFDLTSKLDIHRASLTIDGYNKLASCEKLKHIRVVSDVVEERDLQKLKSILSDCYIELNDEEITA